MVITRRSSTAWPPTHCASCATRIDGNQPAHLLSAPNREPVTLCETCGQVIATESDPTRLIQYLDLFPTRDLPANEQAEKDLLTPLTPHAPRRRPNHFVPMPPPPQTPDFR